MQRVFVLDKNKNPLMPCIPYRARKLLGSGKAKVYRRYPFTIILIERQGGNLQEIDLKLDPGSKVAGFALVAKFDRGHTVVWAMELTHRGDRIRQLIEKRRAIRRSRRNRKTRYRKPRFNNRRRREGWLAPSLLSRAENVLHWSRNLCELAPVLHIAVETMRFDTQKMQKPEISGVEYQQGELFGYEVREYLLSKWNRKCAYCDRENVPLEIEHIVPKSRGGSDRISNLTLSCKPCNKKKGNSDVAEFLRKDKLRLERILKQAKEPLKDAAAVNSIRYAMGERLSGLGIEVSFWSGGRTKYNRMKQGLGKAHWIDAACVGERGEKVKIPLGFKPFTVYATGRGSRQACRVDQYGFLRTSPKKAKRVHGFQTGDMVKAIVTKGKKVGTYIGRVAVRGSGSFNISTSAGLIQGISYRYCNLIQRTDGYSYSPGGAILPRS